jgi:hypothetical protein
MSGSKQQKATQPVPVARASMVWDHPSPLERTGPVQPASSLRARIAAERARTGRGVHLELRPALATAGAWLVAGAVVGASLGTAALAVTTAAVGALMGLALVAVWSFTTGGPVLHQLRRQIRRESRVAASLAPLESAGWTVLHDRLVAAHRVPHVLVGPPGAVLVYDYLAGSWWRYLGRRAAALVHSAVALVLSVPLVMLHRRGLPPLSTATPVKYVTPGPDALRTAEWARNELVKRLSHRPELDDWTITVSLIYVLLSRPNDRITESGTGVGFTDLGARARTHLETALPAGLTRDAAAFLAVVVDDACPPA